MKIQLDEYPTPIVLNNYIINNSYRIQEIINKYSFHINEACRGYLMDYKSIFISDASSFDSLSVHYSFIEDLFTKFTKNLNIDEFMFVQCFSPSKNFVNTVIFQSSCEENYYSNIVKLTKLKAFI